MGFSEMKDKVTKVLKDEKASDDLLDKAAAAAKKATGGKADDKIEKVRDIIDKKVGDE